MKKIFLILVAVLYSTAGTYAQKFAYVDTDYILNKIPEFKQAQDKLDAFSSDWQKEIEDKFNEVEKNVQIIPTRSSLSYRRYKNKKRECYY